MKIVAKLVVTILLSLTISGLPQPASAQQANEPANWPINNNYYQVIIEPSPISWGAAKEKAEAASFQGRIGHLATVTSEGENDFIKNLANGNYVWLGGKLLSVANKDSSFSANWYWASGPESGMPFSLCDQSSATTCKANYENWDDSAPTMQPDMTWGEDSLAMIGEHPQTTKPGSWHDCPNNGTCAVYGYVVEYESDLSPFIQTSSSLGFQGNWGRTEANLEIAGNQLLVSGVSGPGKVLFLNLESLAIEHEVNVPTTENHFSYPLISGESIFLSNSFGSSGGTWIRRYDSETKSFGEPAQVCSKAGYDKGVAKDGLLYIPCTDELVVLTTSNLEVVQTLTFVGHAVQPAVTGEHIWVPIHDGNLLKFEKSSGNLIQSIAQCSNSQSIHVVEDQLVCLELEAVKVLNTDGQLLGQSTLPQGISSYYRSQDSSGIWISNLSQNLISHFNSNEMRVDKIIKTSGYSSGSAVSTSATYVATGDGRVSRISTQSGIPENPGGGNGASAASTLLTFETGDTLGAAVEGGPTAQKPQGGFEGATTSIAVAPAGGNGGNALKITKNVGAQVYAGATFIKFGTDKRVTNGAHKVVTFNYYSPKANSPVNVELRPYPNALGKIVNAPQGWSTITVDFTNVAGWTDAEEFTLLSIFPDFNQPAGDVAQSYYVDNLAFNGAVTPEIPAVSVPRTATSTLLTFEAADTLGAKVVGDSTQAKPEGGFEGAVTTIDNAPALGNGGKALKIVKSVGSATYAGANIIRFGADKRVTNGNYSAITFNYYSPKTTSNVRVEVSGYPNAVGKTVAAPKGWSKITVDFTGVAGWSASEEFVSVILFPDFDVAGAGDAFYVDNLAFNGATTPAIPVPAVKPSVKTAATVAGTAKVAKTLTAGKGSWTGTATITYTYKWYRCTVASTKATSAAPTSSAKCASISGGTKSTYKLVKSDIGSYMRVLVIAKNSAGTSYSLSKTTSKKIIK